MAQEIPILDFNSYHSTTTRGYLVDEIVRSLTTVGFFYLKNHGIPEQKITAVEQAAEAFFAQDEKVKSILASPQSGTEYFGIDTESFSDIKEVRESFDFIPSAIPAGMMTSAGGLIGPLNGLYGTFVTLTNQLLHCIALGLKVPDENYFVERHTGMGKAKINNTTLCLLHYPVLDKFKYGSNATRLGTHADWGTLTLLFQRKVGGLEVETRDGVFIPATPIPGTVLVNIGELLELWSGGSFKAARHRVTATDSDLNQQERYCTAFFVGSDYDVVVESLDPKFVGQPVVTRDHFAQRYLETAHHVNHSVRHD